MNKRQICFTLIMITAVAAFARGNEEKGLTGDLVIHVNPGREWIHDFNIMIKTPPQYAIWMEDESGKYLKTVYVTRKAATEGWKFNKGNRRIESLPRWMHKRNMRDAGGVLLPSQKAPLTDGVTGATPKEQHIINMGAAPDIKKFRVVLEINQSTDFNQTWPENASASDDNWSGGPEGSGQPALVYSVLIDSDEPGPWKLGPEGHSSADGSDGNLYYDLTGFTTARDILGLAQVEKLP